MAESVAHVALAAVTALSWLGLGGLVLRGSTAEQPLLGFLSRVAVGAIGFGLLTFAAALLHLLYAWLYLPLLAATALVGLRFAAAELPRVRRLAWRSWPRWQLALVALLGLYAAIDVFATAAPISSADALLVHAATPAVYVHAHRAVEIPGIWTTYQPFTVEMLVLDGELLWDPIQGAFAPLLLGIGAAAAVTGIASRLAGRGVGLLAGAVFLAEPFMSWQTTSTFVEPGLAFALTLAAWNLFDYRSRGGSRRLVVAGVLVGGALGMKYTGIVAAAALLVAVAALEPRRPRGRTLLLFALPAVAIGLPWYVKNAVQTGNPLYPFYFGGENADGAAETSRTLGAYGRGRSPLDALLLPARLLADGSAFDRGEFLSPLFVLFAPLALLRPRQRRAVAAVWAGVLLYIVWWFSGSQQVRYLLPVLPAVAVLAALGIVALARSGRIGSLVARAVVVGSLALSLAIAGVYVKQFVRVVTGLQSQRAFLRQEASYYTGVEWLNRHVPRGSTVLLDTTDVLYLQPRYVVWTSDALAHDAGAAAMRAFVRRERITTVAVIAGDDSRQDQVGYLPARLLARIPVRSVVSRTRGTAERPETMLVYALRPSA